MNMRSIQLVGLVAGAMVYGVAGLVQAAEGGRTFFVSSVSGDEGLHLVAQRG